jgi:hypothetical protein
MDTQRIKHAVWSWEAIGAFCCFTSGMGAALLGTVLTAIPWMLGTRMHPWLHGLGTAFGSNDSAADLLRLLPRLGRAEI